MQTRPAARWTLYLTFTLLAAVTLVFVVVFVIASETGSESIEVNEDYSARVAELLAGADPARGEPLIVQMDCAACHISAAGVGIAPAFEGIAERAGTRRSPLIAAEYIYESILYPTRFVVEGYAGSMPQNYAERLSDEQLGDIIAYLLTLK